MKNQPTRLRDLKVGVRDLIIIPPAKILIEKGHNPRNYNLPENMEHLNEIKQSIKAVGIRVPLLVRFDTATGEAVLVDGECRLTAALQLIDEGVPIEGVPVVQEKGGNEAERLITALTANTGKPLSKWEIGTAFVRLVNFGWEVDKIASSIGYSVRYVNECMDLSGAPDDVKQLLSLEAVTPSLALKHIRENGSSAGAVLKEKVDAVKAKNPTAKKVTAKREKKNTGIRLSEDDAAAILKALKRGQKSEDESLAKLCAEAIEIMDSK